MKTLYAYFDNLRFYSIIIYEFIKHLNAAFEKNNNFVNLVYQTSRPFYDK